MYSQNFKKIVIDVEVLDSIIPLAPDKLEGHEDDGVTTILCLGNDPFSSYIMQIISTLFISRF